MPTVSDFGSLSKLVPQYLMLKCSKCNRYRKTVDLRVEIISDPKRGRIGTISGECPVCREVVQASIHTPKERQLITDRTMRYYHREEQKKVERDKRNKEQNITMPLKKSTKAAAATKTSAKTTKVKAATGTKTKTDAKTSKTSTERQSHFVRKDGQPNQTVSMAMAFSGGPHTIEEVQKRHDSLAKAGTIARRTTPFKVSDGSWMVRKEQGVKIEDKYHEVVRGKNEDGEDVFAIPSLPDALVKGAKPFKLRERNGKMFIGTIQMAKDLKEIRGETSTKKASTKKATAKTDAPKKRGRPAKK